MSKLLGLREAQDNLAVVSKPQLTNNSTQQSNRENGCLYFWPIARYVRERLLELSHISCGSGWWWLYKCEGKPHPLSKLFRLREIQDHLPICESHYEKYIFISWVRCLTFVFWYIDILQSEYYWYYTIINQSGLFYIILLWHNPKNNTHFNIEGRSRLPLI